MDSPTPLNSTVPYQSASESHIPESTEYAFPQVADYRIRRELGRGGMGVVYEAEHLPLKRVVALKMTRNPVWMTTEGLIRLRKEAEAVARLQHPNIIQIFDVGEATGSPFIAFEFCPGGNLASRLNGQPMVPRDAVELVKALAKAVQVAHDGGIVHRDLKPANILLAADGSPKIADFGLARIQDDSINLTQEGAILGTPCYMAPEQASGNINGIGPHTDVYALGAILYELLTGQPPFKAATHRDTLLQILTVDPVPPSRIVLNLAADLERICLRCLKKQPSERFGAASELAAELERWRQQRSVGTDSRSLPSRLTKLAHRYRWEVAILGTCALALFLISSPILNAMRDRSEKSGPPVMPGAELQEARLIETERQTATTDVVEGGLVPSGWAESLFDGDFTGWRFHSGAWLVRRDVKAGPVIEGEDGSIARSLPQIVDGDGLRRLEHFALEFAVQLRQAEAMEVHFGEQLMRHRDGTKYVLRITKDRISLARRSPDSKSDEPITEPTALEVEPNEPQRIRIEYLMGGWMVLFGSTPAKLVGTIPADRERDPQEFHAHCRRRPGLVLQFACGRTHPSVGHRLKDATMSF